MSQKKNTDFHLTKRNKGVRSKKLRGGPAFTPKKVRNNSDADLKKKIINFLDGKLSAPQKTIVIAKACNCSKAKEINPALYYLNRKGFIEKCNDIPPTWQLNQGYTTTIVGVQNPRLNSQPLLSKGMVNTRENKSQQLSITSPKQIMGSPDNLFRNTLEDRNAPGAYITRDKFQNESERTVSVTANKNKNNTNNGRLTIVVQNERLEQELPNDKINNVRQASQISCGPQVDVKSFVISPSSFEKTDIQHQNEVKRLNSTDVDVSNVFSVESSSDESDDDDDINSMIEEMVFTKRPNTRHILLTNEDKSSDGDFISRDESSDDDMNWISKSFSVARNDISIKKGEGDSDTLSAQNGGPASSPAQLLQNSLLFKMSTQPSTIKTVGIGRGLGTLSLYHNDRLIPCNVSTTNTLNGSSAFPSTISSSKADPNQPANSRSIDSSTGDTTCETKHVKNKKDLLPWLNNMIQAASSSSSHNSLSQSSVHCSTNSVPLNPFPLSLQPATTSTQPLERRTLLQTPLINHHNNVGLSTQSSYPSVHLRQALLPNPGTMRATLPIVSAVPTAASSSSLQINSESFAALNKNPISALMEYAQSRKISAQIEVISQWGPSHKPTFFIVAFVGSRRFPGVKCHNKKDGRKEAADQAIRMLIAEGEYQAVEEVSVMRVPQSDMTNFDKVAALIHSKFNQLIATIPENFTGRKVIAGLVMKMNADDVGSVIAVGSGNRCVTGDLLSLEGNTVNDCHAEIITRRGFLRFLYSQLSNYRDDQDHPLFQKSETGKFCIKEDISFHLYISTAPCGDGALFSPRDAESNSGALTDTGGEHRPTFTTSVQGVLRTKMEGGEGTIPINPSETVQTWDGIVRGERLRTMSCSDKICRWNVVGMQGALLSHFLDPIYLNSLTLGFLYDHGHLSRAVCCRLDRGNTSFKTELPECYRLNHPSLGRVTACDAQRETQKTKSYSINWSACEEKPEMLDGTLGLCHTVVEKKMFSRLSKSNMYSLFKSTCHQLNRLDLLSFPNYHQAKESSEQFTAAKKILMKQFQTANCGKWVSKPIEEEMFHGELR